MAPTESSARDSRLNELIASYLEASAAGQPPDRAALLSEHSEFADELRAFLADHDRMNQAAAPLREDAEGDRATTADTNTSSESAPFPQPFGDYELLDEIGRGGMGIVYKARQISLNRIVALKRIRAGQLASAEDIARFQREAKAAAGLDHPHIVPIYEVGEHQGQHYFTMKLIEGGNLNAHLSKYANDAKATAQVMSQIATAVHHAHQRGILHRDLKPGNILIDAEGNPHVSDFGLAQPIEREAKLTQSGAIVGTPEYMAPEQARGEKGLTMAADVYGLGAIFYVLLTGQPPFQGDYNWETLKRVVEEEPRSPRSMNRKVNRDLETICLKCLAKSPDRRYGSAEGLAEELERWRDGKPILARVATIRERVWKWVRRRPALTALIVVCMIAFGGGYVLWTRLNTASDAATVRGETLAQWKEELDRQESELAVKGEALETTRDHSRHHMVTTQLLRANELYKDDPERALELLYDADACPIDARDAAWRFQERVCRKRLATRRIGEVEIFPDEIPAPDGKRYALVRPTGGADAVVMDLTEGTTVYELKTRIAPSRKDDWEPYPYGARLTADGRTIYLFPQWPRYSTDTRLYLQDVPSGTVREVEYQFLHRKALPGRPVEQGFMMRMSPDGRTIADYSSKHGVWLLATESEKVLATVRREAEDKRVGFPPVFSPDGKYLAVVGNIDKSGPGIVVLDTTSGRQVAFLAESNPWVTFSHDGRTLVAIGGKKMSWWDVPAASCRLRVDLGGSYSSVTFSRDDRLLAVSTLSGDASRKSVVRIWNVEQDKEIRTFYPRTGGNGRGFTAFSPDGSRLVHVSDGNVDPKVGDPSPGEVSIVNLTDGHVRVPLRSPACRWATLTADGKLLVDEGGLRIQDFDASTFLATLQLPEKIGRLGFEEHEPARRFAREYFSYDTLVYLCPERRYVALWSKAELRVVEIATGKKILVISQKDRRWQPEFLGKSLMVLHALGSWRRELWDLKAEKQIGTAARNWPTEPWNLTGDWPKDLQLKDSSHRSEDASTVEPVRGNDGNAFWVVPDKERNLVRILKFGSREEVARHPGTETRLIWLSQDRRRLLVDRDRTLELYEAKTGRLINSYALKIRYSNENGDQTLTVCPNLKSVVEYRAVDQSVHLVDLTTGRTRAILCSNEHRAVGACFNADTLLLATWDATGLVRIWDLGDPFEYARFRGNCVRWGEDDSTLTITKGYPSPRAALLVDNRTGQKLNETKLSYLLADSAGVLERFPALPPVRLFKPGPSTSSDIPRWLFLSRKNDIKVQVEGGDATVTNLTGDKAIAQFKMRPFLFEDRSRAILSPGGRWLAYADQLIRLNDGRTTRTRELAGLNHWEVSLPVAFSFDDTLLAVGGSEVELFDTGSGKRVRSLKTDRLCTSLAFRADGKKLALAFRELSMKGGTLGDHRRQADRDYGSITEFWDVATWKMEKSIRVRCTTISDLAFSPTGRYLSLVLVGTPLDGSMRISGQSNLVVLWDLSKVDGGITSSEWE